MTIAMTAQESLLVLWVIAAAIGVAGGSAVLVWAVRRRQFSDQDRARYLPFLGETPQPPRAEAPPRDTEETRHVPH
jgi:cbb3-type cytochrome oxidase maturation protein